MSQNIVTFYLNPYYHYHQKISNYQYGSCELDRKAKIIGVVPVKP